MIGRSACLTLNVSCDATLGPRRDGARRPATRYLADPDLAKLTIGAARMSMAFLRDDAEGEMPRRHYDLPQRDDPEYDRAAARALLEAARVNETQLAERATGYYWGEPRLRQYVEEFRAAAEAAGDDRLEQVARRYLR